MHNFVLKNHLCLISDINTVLHGKKDLLPGSLFKTNLFSDLTVYFSSMILSSLLLTVTFICFTTYTFAGQVDFDKEIEISDLSIGELRLNEFKIEGSAQLRISGRAIGDVRSRHMHAYAWILDADSREIVWKMDVENASTLRRSRRGGRGADLLRYDESIGIGEGNYELYYIVEDPSLMSPVIQRLPRGRGRGRLFENLIGRRQTRLQIADLGITVSGNSRSFSDNSGYLESLKQNSIVSFTPASDNKYFRQGFQVSDDINVRIYAIGEFATYDETGNDFGWIVNTETNEKIWEMRRSHTQHAGGGDKNRKADEIIKIPKGNYIAYYVSDGSHSFDAWNVASPYDPYFWGLSILPSSSGFDRSLITMTDEEHDSESIINLIGIQNDEIVSQGFTLSQQTDVRVFVVGESDYDLNYMADFGWILSADSRGLIWRMEVDDTESAGGHYKNRMVDRILTLDPGNYIVYYYSDDSHSFNNWNETPPYDPDHWGITIYNADANTNTNDISKFNPAEFLAENVIVSINQTPDDAEVRQSFFIENSGDVLIYALGEGQYGRLADYGWIERFDNGQIIWEMSYRITENAGGAQKNRMFYDVIDLDEGRYILHYVTDDSHSYESWNDMPPFDPMSWGITLFKVNK